MIFAAKPFSPRQRVLQYSMCMLVATPVIHTPARNVLVTEFWLLVVDPSISQKWLFKAVSGTSKAGMLYTILVAPGVPR